MASDRTYLARLRQQLDELYNPDDLLILCSDLGVDYHNLPGETKVRKAHELVLYLDKRERLAELVAECEKLWPQRSWKKDESGRVGLTSQDANATIGKGKTTTQDSADLDNTVPAPAEPMKPNSKVKLWVPKVTPEPNEGMISFISRSRYKNATAKKQDYGEPEWVEIPAGEFWMGSEEGGDNEKPLHRLFLDTFWIAKTPVTNAQYRLFVKAAAHRPPRHWQERVIPAGLEQHPVVHVSWDDALAYCRWLSEVTAKTITLPSEAEWEKAARGDRDKRAYPWGDSFDPKRANTKEAGVGKTSPVGSYPGGASPYGVLDMCGNVLERTRSLYQPYPYKPEDGREDLSGQKQRVLRGGSWYNDKTQNGCSVRHRLFPPLHLFLDDNGVRLCVSPFTSGLP